LGLSAEEAFNRLGTTTFDLYMNGKAFWRNVPAEVFDYHIGGYPVIRRWLSYREEHILGRPLGDREARELAAIIRRIAALLLLEPLLDENYEAVKGSCYLWTGDQ
jgi:Type ISP C-terminal specificity domain